MQVDATIPQSQLASQPVTRTDAHTREQASSRPVDRPPPDQAAENRHPASERQPALASERPDNERREARDTDDSAPPAAAQRGAADPARVGELLDVLA